MSAVRNVIGRLEALREELSQPAVFYAEHRAAWLELAKTVVRQVLANLKPIEMDAGQWQRQIVLAVDRVAADLLSEEDAGIMISIGALPIGADPEDPRHYATAGVNVDEVMRWVEAGRDAEMDGKRLGGDDEGKTDRQIAWRILYALKLNKPGAEGLRTAILKFLGRESGESAEVIYPEILKAWLDVFTVRAAADFRKWVGGKVRRANQGR